MSKRYGKISGSHRPGSMMRMPTRKLNKRQVTQVKHIVAVGREKDFFDTLTSSSVLNTGIVTDISLVPQGNADRQREGDRIRLRYINIRLTMFAATTAAQYNTFRFIVFQWKPNSTPLINAILQASTVTGDYNWDNRQQYNILYDKLVTVVQGTESYARAYSIKVFGKKLNKQLQYQNGGTSGTNHVYWLAVTDDTLTPSPGINVNARLVYDDA